MQKHSLTLTHAITGYLLEKEAIRLSDYTLGDYRLVFRRLIAYLGPDKPINEITHTDIIHFMAHLAQLNVAPAGAAPRREQRLSNKTLRNHHTALCSLWTWATENGYAERHIMRDVPRPKSQRPPIDPFSQDDIRAMLDACNTTRTYAHHKNSEKGTVNTRPTKTRDRAVILLLLDTGIRASELCNLKLKDVDIKNRHIEVEGKGRKRRILPFCSVTGRAIWDYMVTERDGQADTAPLFLTINGTPMTRNALQKIVRSIGARAWVPDTHPHRFRHTFAVMYLRNGGNAYALRHMLGHSTLEMVEQYLTFIQADTDAMHKSASPVANMMNKRD